MGSILHGGLACIDSWLLCRGGEKMAQGKVEWHARAENKDND